MGSNTTVLIVLGVVNIPVYVLVGKLIFGCWGDFFEAITFLLNSDRLSILRGEFVDNFWAELKLGFLVAVCGGCVYGEYILIQKFFIN